MKIKMFDTTLRDGMQGTGISFSVNDKINIIKLLDELGIDYIEIGFPAANPKDMQLIEKIKKIKLNHAKIAVFGSTCKVGILPENDESLQILSAMEAENIVIFGKSWKLHVNDVLKTDENENLRMIGSSIKFLADSGKKVIFDAEHFFDGYTDDPVYAEKIIQTAIDSGAESIALCDSSGNTFPEKVFEITKKMTEKFDIKFGIHAHDDCGMACINSIAAVRAGVDHVQGTLNGIGERCGNANLSTIIANLSLKLGFSTIEPQKLQMLTKICRQLAGISNISISKQPFVGRTAFFHKAGMHVDAVMKNSMSYEHIKPEMVGNERNLIISEISGRSSILQLIQRIFPEINRESELLHKVLNIIKEKEMDDYQYEGAEASLELLIRKELGLYKAHFSVEKLKLVTEHCENNEKYNKSTAYIELNVNGEIETTETESDGPVHAMDLAIRKALCVFYPELSNTNLTDYKVRVLDARFSTGAKVRVLMETTDGTNTWTTIGVSVDVIEASKIALIDSMEYKLINM